MEESGYSFPLLDPDNYIRGRLDKDSRKFDLDQLEKDIKCRFYIRYIDLHKITCDEELNSIYETLKKNEDNLKNLEIIDLKGNLLGAKENLYHDFIKLFHASFPKVILWVYHNAGSLGNLHKMIGKNKIPIKNIITLNIWDLKKYETKDITSTYFGKSLNEAGISKEDLLTSHSKFYDRQDVKYMITYQHDMETKKRKETEEKAFEWLISQCLSTSDKK